MPSFVELQRHIFIFLLYIFKNIVYNLNMLLNDKQIKAIQNACSEVDYGSITIKMNKEAKFIDIVIEKQIRLQKEPTICPSRTIDKKYSK